MLNAEISEYLENVSFQDEFEIADALRSLGKEASPSDELDAEIMAFDFIFSESDGAVDVTKTRTGAAFAAWHIDYWLGRLSVVKNPILICRYAQLVWIFSLPIKGENADQSVLTAYLDSVIEIGANRLQSPGLWAEKFSKALKVGGFSDSGRASEMKSLLLRCSSGDFFDTEPSLWAFPLSISDEYANQFSFKKEEKDELITRLRERISNSQNDPQLAEDCILALAQHYSRSDDETQLLRALSEYEECMLHTLGDAEDAFVKSHAYGRIRKVLDKFSKYKGVRRKLNDLALKIGKQDLSWDDSLKTVRVSTPVLKKDWDEYTDSFFDGNDIEKTVTRIAIRFVLKSDETKRHFAEIVRQYPLQFIIPGTVLHEDGFTLAEMGSIDQDYTARFSFFANQNISIGTGILTEVMKQMKKRFGCADVSNLFKKSSLFGLEDERVLDRAFVAYWEDDYVVASHLFIPMIETAFRNFFRLEGIQYTEPNKHGGYSYLPLGSLLGNGEKRLNQLYSRITDDVSFYFRMVLTHQLGLNLRNEFAHGISKKQFLTEGSSDRLFHIMACLSLIKLEATGAEQSVNLECPT